MLLSATYIMSLYYRICRGEKRAEGVCVCVLVCAYVYVYVFLSVCVCVCVHLFVYMCNISTLHRAQNTPCNLVVQLCLCVNALYMYALTEVLRNTIQKYQDVFNQAVTQVINTCICIYMCTLHNCIVLQAQKLDEALSQYFGSPQAYEQPSLGSNYVFHHIL